MKDSRNCNWCGKPPHECECEKVDGSPKTNLCNESEAQDAFSPNTNPDGTTDAEEEYPKDGDEHEVFARLRVLRGMIERGLPGSRAISCALTKIDESEMWFKKALDAYNENTTRCGG